jgi:ribosome-associated protein YbcJ (S4-like RNA binding protein)
MNINTREITIRQIKPNGSSENRKGKHIRKEEGQIAEIIVRNSKNNILFERGYEA